MDNIFFNTNPSWGSTVRQGNGEQKIDGHKSRRVKHRRDRDIIAKNKQQLDNSAGRDPTLVPASCEATETKRHADSPSKFKPCPNDPPAVDEADGPE